MNKDEYKTLIRNVIDRKPTEEELKEYEKLEKEFLGDPVKKTGIYADNVTSVRNYILTKRFGIPIEKTDIYADKEEK